MVLMKKPKLLILDEPSAGLSQGSVKKLYEILRKIKEEEILSCSLGKKGCIWIATQIVEASLDIDFDFLITESSTIDSLFQRFGRCYRKRSYDAEKPNVIVCLPGKASTDIYDKETLSKLNSSK